MKMTWRQTVAKLRELFHTQVGGDDPQKPCSFPFRFEGKIYNSCTPDGVPAGATSWCATRTNPSTGNAVPGHKGNCRSGL